jgi:hypothetical protein
MGVSCECEVVGENGMLKDARNNAVVDCYRAQGRKTTEKRKYVEGFRARCTEESVPEVKIGECVKVF